MGNLNGTLSTFLDSVLALFYIGLFAYGWRAMNRRPCAPAPRPLPVESPRETRNHEEAGELMPVA